MSKSGETPDRNEDPKPGESRDVDSKDERCHDNGKDPSHAVESSVVDNGNSRQHKRRGQVVARKGCAVQKGQCDVAEKDAAAEKTNLTRQLPDSSQYVW